MAPIATYPIHLYSVSAAQPKPEPQPESGTRARARAHWDARRHRPRAPPPSDGPVCLAHRATHDCAERCIRVEAIPTGLGGPAWEPSVLYSISSQIHRPLPDTATSSRLHPHTIPHSPVHHPAFTYLQSTHTHYLSTSVPPDRSVTRRRSFRRSFRRHVLWQE